MHYVVIAPGSLPSYLRTMHSPIYTSVHHAIHPLTPFVPSIIAFVPLACISPVLPFSGRSPYSRMTQ
ncbi:hypothetical protein VTO73DRAFT_2716 [Trametes versicolor]